jgi:hypothetical protein
VLLTDTTETFGLNGRLLSSVIDARARLLKPDARMLPSEIELRVAPVEAPQAYNYLVDVWARDVRGFDLSAIRPFAANNKQPFTLDANALLAEPATLGALDLGSLLEPAFAGLARVTATRAGTAHGLAGFFAARLAEGITLSNDPREPTVGYVRALLPRPSPWRSPRATSSPSRSRPTTGGSGPGKSSGRRRRRAPRSGASRRRGTASRAHREELLGK